MIEQLKTVRYLMDTYCPECHDGYAALTQLEAMVGSREPVAWVDERAIAWIKDHPRGKITTTLEAKESYERPMAIYTAAPVAQQQEVWHLSKDGLPPIGAEVIGGYFYKDTWLKGEPEVFAWGPCRVIPTDDPEFQDGKRWLTFGPSHNQITHWRAAPLPPGAATAAQQPQARPDFTDEWTGYLKNGETPFERFLRERKDLTALTKLYQRALEENESLKAQQPQKLEDVEQYRMQMAGICAAAMGYWKEGDSIHPDYDTPALHDVAKLYAKYDALYKAQQPQAEAVPPGYVLVPVDLDEMWAYRVIRHHQPHLDVGCEAWLKCLKELLHWHAAIAAQGAKP